MKCPRGSAPPRGAGAALRRGIERFNDFTPLFLIILTGHPAHHRVAYGQPIDEYKREPRLYKRNKRSFQSVCNEDFLLRRQIEMFGKPCTEICTYSISLCTEGVVR